jgi:hypothetical protein
VIAVLALRGASCFAAEAALVPIAALVKFEKHLLLEARPE